MLLRTYIDDSKDETQQKYFIAAALVGSHDEWGHFNREWKRVLRISPRIKYFHAKEWRGLDGEFRQFRDPDKWPRPKGGEAADEKRNSPRDVIEKSRILQVAVTVSVPVWNQVRNSHPEVAKFLGDDPYVAALQSVFFELACDVKDYHKKNRIGFVCDDEEKADFYRKAYKDFRKHNPTVAKVMNPGLLSLDDKVVPGLQAADMTANFVNTLHAKYGCDKPIPIPLPDFTQRFYKLYFWNYDYAVALVKANTGIDLSAQEKS